MFWNLNKRTEEVTPAKICKACNANQVVSQKLEVLVPQGGLGLSSFTEKFISEYFMVLCKCCMGKAYCEKCNEGSEKTND